MRIRTAFVSNSSSSSYICESCGTIDSGYDSSMEDLGFVQCINGHIFCDSHLPEGAQKVEPESEWDEPAYRAEDCPICTLAHIGSGFIAEYYLALHHTNRAELAVELKRRFGSADAVYAFNQGRRPAPATGGGFIV